LKREKEKEKVKNGEEGEEARQRVSRG